MIAESGDAC